MRKWMAICLLAACIAVFSGCMGPGAESSSQMNGEEIGRTVKQNLNTTAQIKMKDISCTAELEKGTGYLTFSFTQPESLKDMRLTLKGEELEVSYKGLSASFDSETLLNSSIMQSFLAAVDKAGTGSDLDIRMENGYLVVAGTAGDSQFEFHLNNETGNFIKLTFPQDEMEFVFDNFQFAY